MNRLAILTILLPLVGLTSCTSQSPQDLAKNHLELIKSGKSAEAVKQYCSLEDSLRLYNLKSYSILSSNTKTKDSSQYIEVVAQVDSNQTVINKSESKTEPLTQVVMEVWKSDDIYNKFVATAAKINDSTKKINAITGSSTELSKTPDREKFNKSEYCIYLPFKQFGE